jgi:hypothetical protein
MKSERASSLSFKVIREPTTRMKSELVKFTFTQDHWPVVKIALK